MHILKTQAQDILSMNPELEGKEGASRSTKKNRPTSGQKASSYALLNRPSPPF
jgi:hypothetical protein